MELQQPKGVVVFREGVGKAVHQLPVEIGDIAFVARDHGRFSNNQRVASTADALPPWRSGWQHCTIRRH